MGTEIKMQRGAGGFAVAKLCFEAVDGVKGWPEISKYCVEDCPFAMHGLISQDKRMLKDWAKFLETFGNGFPEYEAETLFEGWDEKRQVGLFAANFKGKHTGEGGVCAPTGKTLGDGTRYCYMLHVNNDGKVDDVKKIWNDCHAFMRLGWPLPEMAEKEAGEPARPLAKVPHEDEAKKITFFEGLKVADLVEFMERGGRKKGELFTIPEQATVEAALKELDQRNVLSMPVCTPDGKIKGIVSTLDLVVGVVFTPWSERFDAEKEPTVEDIKAVLTSSKGVLESPVSHLMGINEYTREYWEDEELQVLAERLSQGVHRALIRRRATSTTADPKPQPKPKPEPVHLIAQSDLMRFIGSKINAQAGLARCMSQSIGTLGLVEKKEMMITVRDTQTALTAFRKLWQGGWVMDWTVSAVPVVDAQGNLVATLSGSDMRGLTTDNLEDLMLPVAEYLKKRSGGELRAPEKVTMDTPFKEALEKMLWAGIHRLWVTGNKGAKVEGVLSMTDIAHRFATFDLRRHSKQTK
uniref:CBS domain-containing protein n=3 Tax=Lotharella globosa TaxID=91324 RepID=A0A7S3YT20_9EUKA|mmetsp:Transcript_27928/g.54417  ORF Transcript_27928/g.54417 Transcript_27928/m.54417 type:complete len:522 (-) Transcript_27928:232-1797(-)